MAVPTIVSITPSAGRTGGRVLVAIVGTNFRLPTVPAATGPTTPPGPSLRVGFTVGSLTRWAERVILPTTALLYCLVPAMDPGAAAVTVENLDAEGVPIPGESATLVDGYMYRRPDLTATADASTLVRVVRTLLQDLKRQVLENVSLTVHTDFDGDTEDELHIIEDAELPAVVLVGPTLRENRVHTLNKPRQVQDGVQFIELRPARCVDLVFDLTVASESTIELLALMHEATAYFQRNFHLRMDRDPDDPTQGEVLYELAIESDLSVTTAAGDSNLRSASGRFVVRAVVLDEQDMAVNRGRVLEDLVLAGAASTQEPSGVIIGSDVLGETVIGQDPTPAPGDTTGGATAPLPGGTVGSGIDYEQKEN